MSLFTAAGACPFLTSGSDLEAPLSRMRFFMQALCLYHSIGLDMPEVVDDPSAFIESSISSAAPRYSTVIRTVSRTVSREASRMATPAEGITVHPLI